MCQVTPDNLKALTPNHMLLLRHNPCSVPSDLKDSNKFQAWKRLPKALFQKTTHDSDGVVREVLVKNATECLQERYPQILPCWKGV